VPTRLATGGNEVDGAPEFQRNAFSEGGTFRKSVMGIGYYEAIAASIGYVYPRGEYQRGGRKTGKIYLPTQENLWQETVVEIITFREVQQTMDRFSYVRR
jgi:hypothetical protein